MNKLEFYKIQDIDTGLFSCGGYYPRWDKKGKIWKRRSDVNNHIKNVWRHKDPWGYRSQPKNWQLIKLTYELVETTIEMENKS